MTSPPPRWQYKTSSSPLKTSLFNSSISFSYSYSYSSVILLFSSQIRHNNISLSLNQSSSLINCSASARKRAKRSSDREIVNNNNNNNSNSNSNNSNINSKSKLRFKSLFGKRSLWRRILFASTKLRSIILLNVLTLIYASNIPVVKEVEAIIDPATFTVVRFVLSAIPFIPFVVQARGDTRTRNAGLELGVWVSLGYLMQALGLLTSGAGRASFLSMFTVIVVPLLDGMLGAIIPTRTWFGALMSIIGVGMLEASGSPPSVGDLLNFLSAVFFGIHMLRTEHISRSTDKGNFLALLGYEVLVLALFSTLWYCLGVFLDGDLEGNLSDWTWTIFWNWVVKFPWVPALYTGVFSTGLCLWVEMAAMRDVSATETAIIYGLEPMWGAGFAWFLLDERWGITGWFGAALVLGGSLMVQMGGSSSSTLPSSASSGKVSEQMDGLSIIDNKSGLSASPVVVSSRKDIPDILNK